MLGIGTVIHSSAQTTARPEVPISAMLGARHNRFDREGMGATRLISLDTGPRLACGAARMADWFRSARSYGAGKGELDCQLGIGSPGGVHA
jgi:hypothetical protein